MTVRYPSLEQVDAADHEIICYWWRFLPSPGSDAINAPSDVFQKLLDEEVVVMNRIGERLKELGGFTTEISKSIGWDQH